MLELFGLELSDYFVEFNKDVALAWAARLGIGLVVANGAVVPRVPVVVGLVGLYIVHPGRAHGQAFSLKNSGDFFLGAGFELGGGNFSDNSVAGLAPAK